MKFIAQHGWFLFWACAVSWICVVAVEYPSHRKAISQAPNRKGRSLAVFKLCLMVLAGLSGILASLSSQVGSDLTEAKLAPVKLTCTGTNVYFANEKGWEGELWFQNVEMEKPLNSMSIRAEAEEPVIAEVSFSNATQILRDNGGVTGTNEPSLKVMDAKATFPNATITTVKVRVKKPTTVKLTSPNFDGEKVIAIRLPGGNT